MRPSLIRCDLSLPHYFTYSPAPMVDTRPVIPRQEARGLFMRGEFGLKDDGAMRPIVAHNTTHLDVPYHFLEAGADVAAVLNRTGSAADRPILARIVHLGGKPESAGVYAREGIVYAEAVSAEVLPQVEVLRGYEALVILTGFGALMARRPDTRFAPGADGSYHVPFLTESAAERILVSGIRLVALDSTTVEPQTGHDPIRFGSGVHYRLLGHEPPVFIVEGLNGADLAGRLGFAPEEGLLHVIPRRANAAGADASHSRVFLYVYRNDADGSALRALAGALNVEEYLG